MDDHRYVQIVTTTATREDAERIARALVERRLAACVQIDGPIVSHYRWQGAVEAGSEWRCAIKTRAALFDTVAAAIRELHPYEVPEIVALPIVDGSPEYFRWIAESTAGGPVA